MMLRLLLLIAALSSGTLTSGGLTRSYSLYVPPALQSPRTLVVMLHGGGGSGAGMMRSYGMNDVAAQHGFAVVYPDGLERQWNDGRPDAPRPWRAQYGDVDDVGFITALVERIATDLQIDRAHIYVAGHSNGGFMAQHLACTHAELFAAFASVAATMPRGFASTCAPSKAISALLVHGTNDPLVPYGGGEITLGRTTRGAVLGALPSVARWRNLDGCTREAVTAQLPDNAHDGTTVSSSDATGCREGSEVLFYSIAGGGHGWPGAAPLLPERVIGKTSRNINANEVIWEFFARHPQGA